MQQVLQLRKLELTGERRIQSTHKLIPCTYNYTVAFLIDSDIPLSLHKTMSVYQSGTFLW